jgi:ribosome modulation factor
MRPFNHDLGRSGRGPYQQGVIARVEGATRAECPYPSNTVEREDWLAGWTAEAGTSPSRQDGGLIEQRF